MGWERKRGKIEQFNDFVATGEAGGFAVVEGEAAALRNIRFVLTVDADTALRGSVARLVGRWRTRSTRRSMMSPAPCPVRLYDHPAAHRDRASRRQPVAVLGALRR